MHPLRRDQGSAPSTAGVATRPNFLPARTEHIVIEYETFQPRPEVTAHWNKIALVSFGASQYTG